MRSSVQKSLSAIGFLTVTRDTEHGLFGGYLVLNVVGRPLEFHCTAPVRASRAQEILYGPTLEPYLVGERIGQTLLEKSKATPQLVFTDIEAAMAARPLVTTAMALVRAAPVTGPPADRSEAARTSAEPPLPDGLRRDAAHAARPPSWLRLRNIQLDHYDLSVAADYPDDVARLQQHWAEIAHRIELVEPFSRIREAIDEARQGVR